jgi:putative DNA methylase
LSLKDAPALIERLMPVQKLSAEVYKERMARGGQTLTALGSYWKGRKPLILNKACILGCLLPVTKDQTRDLEIFEMLMGMDDESFVARLKFRSKPKDIVATLPITRITDYFTVEPAGLLSSAAPINISEPEFASVQVNWREGITEIDRRRLEAQMLPKRSYRTRVEEAFPPEEVNSVHDHIWDAVNAHLNTYAQSFPELVEQLGIMRFGHRPRVADPFCGSGQIPFEAARLGCDAYASDLNPVACMLTWGAFNIIGGSPESCKSLECKQHELITNVQAKIDRLGTETDGDGWRAKAFLYCIEARCPQSGWMVPLIPSLVVSKPCTGDKIYVIAELRPDPKNNRYNIAIRSGVTEKEMLKAKRGTVRSDGRGQDPYMIHTVNGVEFRSKISTLRGDFRNSDGTTGNKLRQWEKLDFLPRKDDIYQERLYAVQWTRSKTKGKGSDYEFRSVTKDDINREQIVGEFVSRHIADWQKKGWIPDMRIEPGSETTRLSRERGWTYWHHLFNPRQLLVEGLVNQFYDASLKFGLMQLINNNSRLSLWNGSGGGGGGVQNTFYNQALNTLFNYGCRGLAMCSGPLKIRGTNYQFDSQVRTVTANHPARDLAESADIFITDPPYGDAVKYEEILEFFIAWMRKNPPPEFADWVWDSRRSLAITGEDENFRRGMVAAYKRITECMPDNGIQIIMFTHQSGSIWADMANIVWASGLHVTAAWYVVTETENALHEGSYVKGTVLLVLRKRAGTHKTTRDDLAWEIQEEVQTEVDALTGLNQKAKGFYREENVFEDADIQMAGYAAALRVLTRYATIDGRDMTAEAIRPRANHKTTFVDGLIAFAVDTANQSLVPQGISKAHWDKLSGAERFYLKMLDMECRGAEKLDNYQNFAKAFKVRDFRAFMASQNANESRLKSAMEFGKNEMSEDSELHQSVLRAVLYAVMELVKNVDGNEVLAHMMLNISNYYSDVTRREMVVELANYLAKQLEGLRPEEAGNARVLYELVNNQRLG